jgi:hypothetical protein
VLWVPALVAFFTYCSVIFLLLDVSFFFNYSSFGFILRICIFLSSWWYSTCSGSSTNFSWSSFYCLIRMAFSICELIEGKVGSFQLFFLPFFPLWTVFNLIYCL